MRLFALAALVLAACSSTVIEEPDVTEPDACGLPCVSAGLIRANCHGADAGAPCELEDGGEGHCAIDSAVAVVALVCK